MWGRGDSVGGVSQGRDSIFSTSSNEVRCNVAEGGGQTRKSRPKKDEEQTQPEEQKASSEATSEVDDLLDEIDEVLEENAEEFVRSYVQKGGQ